MNLNVGKEVAALQRMTVRELGTRYAEVFGEATRAGNKAWLLKRIAWRLQSQAEGDLSERARQRAAELANDADVRLSPPKAKPATPSAGLHGGVPPDLGSLANGRLLTTPSGSTPKMNGL